MKFEESPRVPLVRDAGLDGSDLCVEGTAGQGLGCLAVRGRFGGLLVLALFESDYILQGALVLAFRLLREPWLWGLGLGGVEYLHVALGVGVPVFHFTLKFGGFESYWRVFTEDYLAEFGL